MYTQAHTHAHVSTKVYILRYYTIQNRNRANNFSRIECACICASYAGVISFLVPGHGYAHAEAHMGYTGQASHTRYTGQASQTRYTSHGAHQIGHVGQGNQAGYGQPQQISGAVGMQHSGATSYGGNDLIERSM